MAKDPVLQKLTALRKLIDAEDARMLKALEQRMKTVRAIAAWKRKNGLTLIQKGRWTQLMRERMALSKKLGLHPSFTRDLFDLIHREALRLQRLPRPARKSKRKSK